ncbi:MAG: acetate kinase [Acidobacteria bacterium]|nr:MAG: acetate kinase [Acidobacteriota bacterium]RLE19946.1 MAG: acetate kinase [Acidobacteriota bacterium]
MIILTLNCGSSSVKYQLINTKNKVKLAKGSVERIGMASSIISIATSDDKKKKLTKEILDHTAAIGAILELMKDKDLKILKSFDEIDAVGHRVVHGGEEFKSSMLITREVKDKLRENFKLAPLHNPPNLKGIEAAERVLAGRPHVGVFDTAFHSSMPPKAYIYALPYVFYKRYQIRRYGFHGTSHRFVSEYLTKFYKDGAKGKKIITAHIGNGASMAAIVDGKSVDTSMGFTPLEGLVMGSRCGDLDPAIILYIMGLQELSKSEADSLLNKHSGLMGISGLSSDVRDLEEEMAAGNKRAKLAMDVYCYRIRKYVGAYAAAMGGLDALIFTAGVGENSSFLRKTVCEGLDFLGVSLDDKKNEERSSNARKISSEKSKADVFVIPTDEELVIALDTEKIVKESKTT